jgi:hypothetical protein
MQRDREVVELSAGLSPEALDFARVEDLFEAIRASRTLPSSSVRSNPPPSAPSAPFVCATIAKCFFCRRSAQLFLRPETKMVHRCNVDGIREESKALLRSGLSL